MANITNEQWQVLINILGAVETGGQQYGQRDYSDYTEAYANSSAENSITIGAFQEFHWLAKGLLQDIKDQYPDVFAKYDNAGIAEDLTLNSWTGYSPSKNSEKAKAIVAIISTSEGRKVQDNRFIEQMKQHVAYGEKKGVTEVPALFEICNISHQGGYSAVDRILNKTTKPYTLDNIYAALCTDTGTNQVGTFVNRQRNIYQWLKQYMPTDTSSEADSKSNVSAETILNIMRGWIGLSMSDGSHAPIINIYNSHKPLARGYAMRMDDDYCACTVSAAFIKANAVDLIGGTEVGVERFIEDVFKPNGIWIEDDDIVPLPGDIICFYWNESRKEVDNRGFGSHIGIVEYVDGDIIHTIEGNSSGGTVRRRTYEIGQACIRGYARPKYGDLATQPSGTYVASDTPSNAPETSQTASEEVYGVFNRLLKRGLSGADVKVMQTMLNKCGYDCGEVDGDFGEQTDDQLRYYQKIHNLEADGIYGPETKQALEDSYMNAKKDTYPKVMYTAKEPRSYMRSGASKNNLIVKKLKVGKRVAVTNEKVNKAENLWYCCDYGNYHGWIVATALRY